MSANIIESFFVALGFEIDDKELQSFSGHIQQAKTIALSLGAAVGAAAGAIGGFVAKVASGIDDLGDFAEAEDVSVAAMTELGYAAQLNGSSLDAVKASISGVNRVVGEAVLGIGRGAKVFEKLGMSAKNADGSVKSVDQVLEEVSDLMQGMSRQEAIAMAEKLGIDRSLIPLLLKGRDAIRQYRDEAKAFGAVTEEDAEAAGALMDALDRTKFMISGMTKSIAVGLMPGITEALDGFRKWVLENREIIKANVGAAIDLIATAISRTWFWLTKIVGAGMDAVRWVMQFKGALTVLAVAVAAWLAPFITVPMLIGAAIAAIALFIDDFQVWMEGGDSALGDLIAKFPAVRDWAIAIWAALNTLWDLIVMAFKGWVMLLDIVGTALGSIWEMGVQAFGAVASAVGSVIDMIRTLVGWIVTGYDKFVNFGRAVKDFFINNPLAKGMSIAADFLSGGQSTQYSGQQVAASPLTRSGVLGNSATTNNSATTTTHVQVQAPITINSPDPAKAGESVRRELDRMNKQATRNGQSAVAL